MLNYLDLFNVLNYKLFCNLGKNKDGNPIASKIASLAFFQKCRIETRSRISTLPHHKIWQKVCDFSDFFVMILLFFFVSSWGTFWTEVWECFDICYVTISTCSYSEGLRWLSFSLHYFEPHTWISKLIKKIDNRELAAILWYRKN